MTEAIATGAGAGYGPRTPVNIRLPLHVARPERPLPPEPLELRWREAPAPLPPTAAELLAAQPRSGRRWQLPARGEYPAESVAGLVATLRREGYADLAELLENSRGDSGTAATACSDHTGTEATDD